MNSDFDVGVDGWGAFAGDGSFGWDPRDYQNSPESGSAGLVNLSSSAFTGVEVRQCVASVQPGVELRFRGRIFRPSTMSDAIAHLTMVFSSLPDCLGGFSPTLTSPTVTTPQETWIAVATDYGTAPPGTQAVLLQLRLTNGPSPTPGGVTALFDGLVLEKLFLSDGFESGDTGAWSLTGQ